MMTPALPCLEPQAAQAGDIVFCDRGRAVPILTLHSNALETFEREALSRYLSSYDTLLTDARYLADLLYDREAVVSTPAAINKAKDELIATLNYIENTA
jgi:hypothetical protein